ncbi:MAG: YafY family protein [Spirochaetales bacterium]|nr:YafY family protein [Spirochaetales bacterium]
MKIDRLLSIIVYLLNHELVSARVLAERFNVTVRTIQRDLESIDLAGIPIISIQGPNGGYGIMENFKIDRQLVSLDDLYYIITSLQSVSETISDEKIDGTLEKVMNLLPPREHSFLTERNEKLSIDFSMLGGDPGQQESFRLAKEAVDTERLLEFGYTNNKLENKSRIVEPHTIAFKWRSWYLYAWCLEKKDYRLFRISRIRNPRILSQRFRRRDLSFDEYMAKQTDYVKTVELKLRFDPSMRSMVEEYYSEKDRCIEPDGSLTVNAAMPADGWMYGFILSYGEYVTVLEPEDVREEIRRIAAQIAKKY